VLASTILGTRELGGSIQPSLAQPGLEDLVGGLIKLDDLGLLIIALSLAVALLGLWSAAGSSGAIEYSILILVFLVSAALTVASANLLLFYIFWELTALCAWGLSRWSTYSDDYTPEAFPIRGAGALASLSMFLAVLLLAAENRSFSVSGLQTDRLGLVSLLILAAVFLKTYGLVAQVWRHDAGRVYSISGGLVSSAGAAVLGVYPYLRLLEGNFAAQTTWREYTLWIALPLGLLAGLAVLSEDEAHRVVAGAAYSQFCVLMVGMALGNRQGLTGAMLGLMAYVLGVNGLFLCLGVLESCSGQRLVSTLGGMAASLPSTAVLFVLSALAFAGLPPFGGFTSRLLVGTEFLRAGQPVAFAALMAICGLTLLVNLRLFKGAFLGPPRLSAREGHWAVLLATVGVLCALVYLGIHPEEGARLVQPAVAVMLR